MKTSVLKPADPLDLSWSGLQIQTPAPHMGKVILAAVSEDETPYL